MYIHISVTQVKCGSKNLAPDNCLQYFTGSTGTIQTYNYGINSVNALIDHRSLIIIL